MPTSEKIRAGVEKMTVAQPGEASPTPIPVKHVDLLNVATIEDNVKTAREIEPQIAPLLMQRDRAIAKARSDRTLRPEFIEVRVKEIEAHSDAEVAKLLEQFDDAAPLMTGQRAHYEHAACLTRAVFADNREGDATIRTSVMMRLARLLPQQLVEAARLAASNPDAASQGCIQDELAARQILPAGDLRALSREQRAELSALISMTPTDSESVSKLLDEFDLIMRRARIAAGRAKSVDKIAVGLMARSQAAQ